MRDYSGNCRPGVYGPGLSSRIGATTSSSDPAVNRASAAATPIASGSADGIPVGNAPRTIEAWVNSPTNATVVLWGDESSSTMFALSFGSSYVEVYAPGGGLFTSPTSLTDGRWHDIAITYDGAGTGVAYADGHRSEHR